MRPRRSARRKRAVTEADYAAVAERHPRGAEGHGHAPLDRQLAHGLRHGRPHGRDGRSTPRSRRSSVAFLEPFRLAGHDVEIDAPRFVPLDSLSPCALRPATCAATVKAALLESCSRRQICPTGGVGSSIPTTSPSASPST